MRGKLVAIMVSLWRSQLGSKVGTSSCGRVTIRWQRKTKADEWVGRCKRIYGEE